MDARGILAAALIVAGIQGRSASTQETRFSSQEREAIRRLWAEPGRVKSTPSERFEVRLTPEGSAWLWKYNAARGTSKGDPAVDPGAQSTSEQAWEKWIDAKVAWDRAQAQAEADWLNGGVDPDDPVPCDPIPDGLNALVGSPPPFAEVVRPKLTTVRFAEGDEITLADNPVMRPRYAFYRSRTGVMGGGTPLKSMGADQRRALFAAAGVNESDERVMCAVSSLEGGFDAINTYDTGFVSVGFIQFACQSKGTGSLGALMLRYRTTNPKDFQADFRRYGIDVTDDGRLVAYDPDADVETVGADAARTIIEQPRLAIVFQKAGRRDAFRVAQIRAAKEMYFPADQDRISVKFPNRTESVAVRDVLFSEAGLATLMDRKVHTGKLDAVAAAVSGVASELNLLTVEDLKSYEGEIIARCQHRRDYLADSGLSQPAPTSRLRDSSKASRGTKSGGG